MTEASSYFSPGYEGMREEVYGQIESVEEARFRLLQGLAAQFSLEDYQVLVELVNDLPPDGANGRRIERLKLLEGLIFPGFKIQDETACMQLLADIATNGFDIEHDPTRLSYLEELASAGFNIQDDQERLRLLEDRTQAEFAEFGFDPEIVTIQHSIVTRSEVDGMLRVSGHKICVELDEYEFGGDEHLRLEATITYHGGRRDGKGREWDMYAVVHPHAFYVNGTRQEFSRTMQAQIDAMGWHVLSRNYHETLEPEMRLESVCESGMVALGHRATYGKEGLGCDCAEQREHASEEIYQKGGLLVLAPTEGRGNGIDIHGGELMMQGAAARYSEPIIDTYDAVLSQGAPQDARTGAGFKLDAIICRIWGIPKNGARVYTNNPEKIEALQQVGFTVTRLESHPEVMNGYYNDEEGNHVTKKRNGGHLGNGTRDCPEVGEGVSLYDLLDPT